MSGIKISLGVHIVPPNAGARLLSSLALICYTAKKQPFRTNHLGLNMAWKRGLFRIWIVISALWVLIVVLVMIDTLDSNFSGDFRVLVPNFGSPRPEKPRTLELEDEYVRTRVAEILGVPEDQIENMDPSERDERASLAINTIESLSPPKEMTELEELLLLGFGEYEYLTSRVRNNRRDALTQEQRTLEDQYESENYLWQERAEFYDFLPRFILGTITLAAFLPLLLLAVYFVLAWITRGFINVNR